MAFTINRSFFIQGGHKELSIHIEANILVTEDGAATLMAYTRQMIVLLQQVVSSSEHAGA